MERLNDILKHNNDEQPVFQSPLTALSPGQRQRNPKRNPAQERKKRLLHKKVVPATTVQHIAEPTTRPAPARPSYAPVPSVVEEEAMPRTHHLYSQRRQLSEETNRYPMRSQTGQQLPAPPPRYHSDDSYQRLRADVVESVQQDDYPGIVYSGDWENDYPEGLYGPSTEEALPHTEATVPFLNMNRQGSTVHEQRAGYASPPMPQIPRTPTSSYSMQEYEQERRPSTSRYPSTQPLSGELYQQRQQQVQQPQKAQQPQQNRYITRPLQPREQQAKHSFPQTAGEILPGNMPAAARTEVRRAPSAHVLPMPSSPTAPQAASQRMSPPAVLPLPQPEEQKIKVGGVGKPVCSKCRGAGYVRADVPFGHPNFGKPIACICKEAERKEKRRQQLREMSNLDAFQDSTFQTFNPRVPGVQEAYQVAREFAEESDGWLVLVGPNGSGKTHLAAAIANRSLEMGAVVLFAVVPDLLDHLRAAFAPDASEVYDQLFAKMREAEVLILDDLGSQQSSPWANEKLFQLLNYRYNMQLPTVITANTRGLQAIDERIRSRLNDVSLAITIHMDRAQDYRPRHPGR